MFWIRKSANQEILDQLNDFFQQQIPKKTKIGVWISGGPDSVFLMEILLLFWKKEKRNPEDIVFIHCHHNLRPESDQEAGNLQKRLVNYPFRLHIRPAEWETSEEALRNRRYTCFLDTCKQEKIWLLFLGHNLTDRIESSLMHMLRGCGMEGFLSMKNSSPHPLLPGIRVLRPLLWLSKPHITSLVEEKKWEYALDTSNTDSSFSLRNLLRNEYLFPLSQLGTENQQGENSFFESRKLIYQTIEQKLITKPLLTPIKNNPYWNSEKAFLREIPNPQKIEIQEIVETLEYLEIKPKKSLLKELHRHLRKEKEGKRYLNGWNLLILQRKIYLIKGGKHFREKTITLEKEIQTSGLQHFGQYQISCPEERIGGILRFPKKGDRYHGKKRYKWAINQKIPLIWRNYLPLVEKEGKVIHSCDITELFF